MVGGVISGMNRGPKFPPRARRAGAKLALTDPGQVEIRGNIQIQIINTEHTDSTDLPTNATNGQMVLMHDVISPSTRLCIYYAGTWYEEVLTAMS
jgi:hypothetical protein